MSHRANTISKLESRRLKTSGRIRAVTRSPASVRKIDSIITITLHWSGALEEERREGVI